MNGHLDVAKYLISLGGFIPPIGHECRPMYGKYLEEKYAKRLVAKVHRMTRKRA